MAASEEVIKEANNGENNVKHDEKSLSGAEKTESLSVNGKEPIQENNETKSDKSEECDGKENNLDNNHDKKQDKKKGTVTDLIVRITGFPKLKNEIEELKLYHTFFTQELNISAPLVEISARFDDSVTFQLKSDTEKTKLFSQVNRRKIYKWRNYSLELKGVPRMSLGLDLTALPLDEAQKLLYPYKEIPYGKQLKEKTETSTDLINFLFPKKEAYVNVKKIVPMTSVEGYDYNVPLTIEEEPETKRIICGIRVTSADRKKTCIVPIELCPNVPHQIKLVTKDFVDHMEEFGFIPFNQKTNEGNVSGIILHMSHSGNFLMTIVVPTTKQDQFKQLSENGIEGDVSIIEDFLKRNETRESLIEKAEKYFNSRGKENGVMSIYMCTVNGRLGVSWNLDNTLPLANHILGDLSITNYCNGQEAELTWTKEYHINNSIMVILNVIQEWGYISSYSSICIVCSHKIIPLYLAERVDKLSVLCSGKRGNLVMMRAWAKKLGLDKIEFIDLKGINRQNSPIKSSTTVIIWHTIKIHIVDTFLSSGITNIIFVSYWSKDSPNEFRRSSKEQLESVSKKLEISKIFPIDIAPYTDRFCLLFFFRAKKQLVTRKRSFDSLETFQPYYEYEYERAKRLKAAYF